MFKLESSKRICKLCNSNNVEYEIHFLFECQAFSPKCIDLLNEVRPYIKELSSSIKISKSCKIMRSNEYEVINSLGKYVYTCFKWRLEFHE